MGGFITDITTVLPLVFSEPVANDPSISNELTATETAGTVTITPNVREDGSASSRLADNIAHSRQSFESDGDPTGLPPAGDVDTIGASQFSVWSEVLQDGTLDARIIGQSADGTVTFDYTIELNDHLGGAFADEIEIIYVSPVPETGDPTRYPFAGQGFDSETGETYGFFGDFTTSGVIRIKYVDYPGPGDIYLGDPDDELKDGDLIRIPFDANPDKIAIAFNIKIGSITTGLLYNVERSTQTVNFKKAASNEGPGSVTLQAAFVSSLNEFYFGGSTNDVSTGLINYALALGLTDGGVVTFNIPILNALTGENTPKTFTLDNSNNFILGVETTSSGDNLAGFTGVNSAGILISQGLVFRNPGTDYYAMGIDGNRDAQVAFNDIIAVVNEFNSPAKADILQFSVIGAAFSLVRAFQLPKDFEIRGRPARAPYPYIPGQVSIFVPGRQLTSGAAALAWFLMPGTSGGYATFEGFLASELSGTTTEYCYKAVPHLNEPDPEGRFVTCLGNSASTFTTTWDLAPDSSIVPEFSLTTLLLAIFLAGGLVLFVVRRRYK
jgi:hypothetical protein